MSDAGLDGYHKSLLFELQFDALYLRFLHLPRSIPLSWRGTKLSTAGADM